jgi:hypothetical protein
MAISFRCDVLPVLSQEGTLVFFAVRDDGKKISCHISFEALRDRLGAKAINSRDLQLAFMENRTAIHKKALEALALNGGDSILLMRDHF